MAERNWVWDGYAWVEAVPPGTGISMDSVIGLREHIDNTIAAAFTAYSNPLYLVINYSTGVWPSRTVPAGHTGIVLWWSLGYENATLPAGMIDTDFWMRNYPT